MSTLQCLLHRAPGTGAQTKEPWEKGSQGSQNLIISDEAKLAVYVASVVYHKAVTLPGVPQLAPTDGQPVAVDFR